MIYRKINLVQQISPYTCALACLESFLKDIGRAETQQSMLQDVKIKVFLNEATLYDTKIYGAVTPSIFENILCELNIKMTKLTLQDVSKHLSALDSKSAIFLLGKGAWSKNDSHAVRILNFEQSKFIVFDPSANNIRDISIDASDISYLYHCSA
jgi:hypothetical protein